MRTGLVLGAGGLVGQAYHAGVLAALELDLGWDPRSADVIVGTSAGSLVASALRLGLPAEDLAAMAVEAPVSEASAELVETLGADPPELPPFDPWSVLRGWRLPSPRLLATVVRRPWAFRPAVAAMTLLPAGQVDIVALASVLDSVAPEGWPPGLRICAARRDDGRRVVFGRTGSPQASLAQAVAASCAIPGYFAPVTIGRAEYFDGGVHSPTNADVLAKEGLDLVIAVSPMSVAHGRVATPDALFRRAAHRRLEREVQKLRATGTEVVRFEPTPRTLVAMGMNAMADDRADRVVQTAFLEAGRRAATPAVAAKLAAIATRPGRRRVTAA